MEIVPFEIAKKLKEKGFPQGPDYFNYSSYYDWDGLRKIHSLSNASVWFDTNISRDNIYFAPTISQVLKWLREEKEIHIVINIWGRTWGYDVLSLPYGSSKHWTAYEENIKSYEQAALAGIEYCLDNLI